MTETQREEVRQLYRKVIVTYFRANQLVAASELQEVRQRLSVTAINEFRAALAHIMRVHRMTYDVLSEKEHNDASCIDPFEYCVRNLDKAYGHLLRCAYDAYDAISISLIEQIERLLARVSPQALYHVLPDASSSVITPFDEAQQLVLEAKQAKDIDTPQVEEDRFREYEEANLKLLTVKSRLQANMPELVRYDSHRRRSTAVQLVLAAVLGWLVSLLLQAIF